MTDSTSSMCRFALTDVISSVVDSFVEHKSWNDELQLFASRVYEIREKDNARKPVAVYMAKLFDACERSLQWLIKAHLGKLGHYVESYANNHLVVPSTFNIDDRDSLTRECTDFESFLVAHRYHTDEQWREMGYDVQLIRTTIRLSKQKTVDRIHSEALWLMYSKVNKRPVVSYYVWSQMMWISRYMAIQYVTSRVELTAEEKVYVLNQALLRKSQQLPLVENPSMSL